MKSGDFLLLDRSDRYTSTPSYSLALVTVKVKILSRDKLAYLLLLNGKDRHAWSSMLVDRMTAKMNTQDQGHRILFYKVTTRHKKSPLLIKYFTYTSG